MAYSVAVDIGGTFTDLVAFDARERLRRLHEDARPPTAISSTGIIDCFAKAELEPGAAVARSITARRSSSMRSSSATARKAALVTTRGFRDVLEIARGNRPDPFDLHYRRDEPLIPRELRFEVDGAASTREGDDRRTRSTPTSSTALADGAAAHRRRSGRGLLHEFLRESAAREQARRRRCAACCPSVYRHQRHRADARMVRVRAHVDGRRQRLCRPAGQQLHPAARGDLRDGGFAGSLFMMGSNGGVLSAERTLPAADGAGRIRTGRRLHRRRRLRRGARLRQCRSRSTWVARPRNARWSRTAASRSSRSTTSAATSTAFRSSRRSSTSSRSAPAAARSPGSIAQKRLHVGPQSAGSTPGPGLLRPRRQRADRDRRQSACSAGSIRPLSRRRDAARRRGRARERSRAHRRAARLSRRATASSRIADGILAIATVIMAGAIRSISVEHGHDPRDFVLFCYGGGGPLHAVDAGARAVDPDA